MSPQLIDAIADRIIRGYAKDTIAAEVTAAGYTPEQFADAYRAAQERTAASVRLIGYGELLSRTGRLLRTEQAVLYKATLLGVAVFVAVSLGIFLVASLSGIGSQTSFFLTAAVVPLIGLLIGFVISLSVLRAVIERARPQLFRAHVRYVLAHFVPLMLVTLYLTIITQVGYALFFFPGIVATVYFLFATPLALTGEVRGFAALTASIALVHGRFFATLGRFVVINLVVFTVVIACVLLGGVLFGTALATNLLTSLIVFPFVFVAMLALAIAAFFATTGGLIILFESLHETKSAAQPVNRASLETLCKVIVGVVMVGLAVFAFMAGFAGYALFTW